MTAGIARWLVFGQRANPDDPRAWPTRRYLTAREPGETRAALTARAAALLDLDEKLIIVAPASASPDLLRLAGVAQPPQPRQGGSRTGAGRKPSPFGPTTPHYVYLSPALWAALDTLAETTRGNVSVAIETVLRENTLVAGMLADAPEEEAVGHG